MKALNQFQLKIPKLPSFFTFFFRFFNFFSGSCRTNDTPRETLFEVITFSNSQRWSIFSCTERNLENNNNKNRAGFSQRQILALKKVPFCGWSRWPL